MKNFSKQQKLVMVPITRETISPRDYLTIHATKPESIKTATFVAPKIGTRGFGSFEIEYRVPKLVPA